MKGTPVKRAFLEHLFTREERLAIFFLMGMMLLGFLFLGWRRALPASAPIPPPLLQVHLNRATAMELAALPGIGPALAKRMVEDRERRGRFLTSNDMCRVKGMTSKTVRQLEGLVSFD